MNRGTVIARLRCRDHAYFKRRQFQKPIRFLRRAKGLVRDISVHITEAVGASMSIKGSPETLMRTPDPNGLGSASGCRRHPATTVSSHIPRQRGTRRDAQIVTRLNRLKATAPLKLPNGLVLL